MAAPISGTDPCLQTHATAELVCLSMKTTIGSRRLSRVAVPLETHDRRVVGRIVVVWRWLRSESRLIPVYLKQNVKDVLVA